MNSVVYKKALLHFKKQDEVFYKKIRKIIPKPVSSHKKSSPYEYLVYSIISQQISTKAADSITNKFLNLFPGQQFDFKYCLELSDEKLRLAGLSRGKAAYIRDLSQRVVDGHLLSPDRLLKMPDDEIIEHLIQVKGIGVWTVQMLLIFYMKRKDILPTGDLAIQKGFQSVFNKRKMPKHKEISKRGAKWTPYRSIASLYLWRAVDTQKKSS